MEEALGLRVKESTKGNTRYILCHNPEVANKKKAIREDFFANPTSALWGVFLGGFVVLVVLRG